MTLSVPRPEGPPYGDPGRVQKTSRASTRRQRKPGQTLEDRLIKAMTGESRAENLSIIYSRRGKLINQFAGMNFFLNNCLRGEINAEEAAILGEIAKDLRRRAESGYLSRILRQEDLGFYEVGFEGRPSRRFMREAYMEVLKKVDKKLGAYEARVAEARRQECRWGVLDHRRREFKGGHLSLKGAERLKRRREGGLFVAMEMSFAEMQGADPLVAYPIGRWEECHEDLIPEGHSLSRGIVGSVVVGYRRVKGCVTFQKYPKPGVSQSQAVEPEAFQGFDFAPVVSRVEDVRRELNLRRLAKA